MVREENGEVVLVCDQCGEEFHPDAWGLYGCLILQDERVSEPPVKVVGVWCNEDCLRRWLDKGGLEVPKL